MRKKVAANAKKRPKLGITPDVQEAVRKVEKVSLRWAKMIARIYEVNPPVCKCGKEMKIVAFVTHSTEIRRILSGIGWPTEIPEFDPPYELPDRDICQLLPWTNDGFSPDEVQIAGEAGPDPPFIDCTSDPPHWEDHSDPFFGKINKIPLKSTVSRKRSDSSLLYLGCFQRKNTFFTNGAFKPGY